MIRGAALALLLTTLPSGCAARRPPLPPDHPASADAPAGRLAGRPAVLRPGVADDVLRPPPRDAGAPP